MSELEIRERIAKVRKNKDMSYQDLADITGISPSTLQRYETGNIDKMPITKLELIAKALGVEPAYLMGWEEDTHEPIQEYDDDALELAQQLSEEGFGELNILFKKTGKLSKEEKERVMKILRATLPENGND